MRLPNLRDWLQPGQEPPVEVVVQFEQLRSRPASLNGRFPASELLAALPQRGQGPPFEVDIQLDQSRSRFPSLMAALRRGNSPGPSLNPAIFGHTGSHS